MKTLILYFDPALTSGEVYVQQAHNEAAGAAPEIYSIETLSRHSPCKIVAVIPGEHLLTSPVELPSKSALKALPYLLEENLAAPVEELHVTHCKVTDSTVIAGAIAHSVLENYLQQLESAGLQPYAIIADYQLLPPLRDGIHLVSHQQRMLVRYPDGTGASVKENQLASLLPLHAKQFDNPPEYSAATIAELLSSESAANPDQLNLMQGAYARRAPTHSDQRWRKAGIYSLAATLTLSISYLLVAGWLFNSKADTIKLESEQLFLSVFPNTKNTNNIRQRMEGYLKNNSTSHSGSGFLTLLARAAPIIGHSHQMRSIRFDQKEGSLQLEIQSGQMENLNQIQQALQNAGMTATVLSASSNDAGVLARISVAQGKES